MHSQRISFADEVQMLSRLAACDHEIFRGDLEPVDRRGIGDDLREVFNPQPQPEAQVRTGPRRRSAGARAGPDQAVLHDQPVVPPTFAQAAAGKAMKPWPLQLPWPLQALVAVLQSL